MSKQWQIRRGTTAENDSFTGAVGELTMDTDKKAIRIHDGSTQGGIKIPSETTADYVVEWQLPTAENGYTWYRKYRSGWVEQGGRTTTSNQTITFPIPFADVPNMTWGLCTSRNNAASYDSEIFFRSITATNFISGSRLNEAVSPGYMWQAVGIAA